MKRTSKNKSAAMPLPMRIQARQGSLAEKRYYNNSALPSGPWPMPAAIANGISPAPLDDLIYHGGRIVPKMEFQNIYLGGQTSWKADDIHSIDSAITLAMQDKNLNNVLKQYFHNATLECAPRDSLVLAEAKPARFGEADVQKKIVSLYDSSEQFRANVTDSVLYNVLLPPGTILTLDGSSSLNGLGGYHGSVHIKRKAKDGKLRTVTLYYSANVYSQTVGGRENGIDVFDASWKNVVATLYHELNEFRTDPDVNDAIKSGNDDFLGWTSRHGQEIGDQPIVVANPLTQVFREVESANGAKRIPVQLMYSNAVHGAEGPIP